MRFGVDFLGEFKWQLLEKPCRIPAQYCTLGELLKAPISRANPHERFRKGIRISRQEYGVTQYTRMGPSKLMRKKAMKKIKKISARMRKVLTKQ
jgi:hypothetical protein